MQILEAIASGGVESGAKPPPDRELAELVGSAARRCGRRSERYELRLILGRDGLDGECDCPWGEEGNFCKHCVAVALVYLYESEHGDRVPRRPDLRPHLEALDRAEPITSLVEAAAPAPGAPHGHHSRVTSPEAAGRGWPMVKFPDVPRLRDDRVL
jgi:hypothetical protein